MRLASQRIPKDLKREKKKERHERMPKTLDISLLPRISMNLHQI